MYYFVFREIVIKFLPVFIDQKHLEKIAAALPVNECRPAAGGQYL
jgi:hypothetical protein